MFNWYKNWKRKRAHLAKSKAILESQEMEVYSMCHDYGQAPCKLCYSTLKCLQGVKVVKLASGEEVKQPVFVGYACLLCRIWCINDTAELSEWRSF